MSMNNTEFLYPTKIEAALKGYEDSNFVKNFWGEM